MKHLKMLTLAFAVAATVAALAGADGASADVLCKAAPNASGECSTTAGDFSVGATLPLTAAVTVTLGEEKLKCHSSLALVITATGGLSGVSGGYKVESFELTACKLEPSGTSCTVTSSLAENLGTFNATGDVGNGVSRVKNPVTMTTTCAGNKCTYTTAENGMEMSIIGGNPGTMVAKEIPFTLKEGFLCPTSPKFSGTYTFLAPTTAVWVATKMA
jgi:hypothetical protein